MASTPEYNRKRYLEKREHILEVARLYREANPEKRKQIVHNYRVNNKGKMAAKEAKRRACKKNATPSWLTKEHLAEIEAIYISAQNTGMHVDYIIPLQNKDVCGLHVPWNLQHLTQHENNMKYNTFKDEV